MQRESRFGSSVAVDVPEGRAGTVVAQRGYKRFPGIPGF